MTPTAIAGSYQYTYDPSWDRMSQGVTHWGAIPGVAVDSQDRVYVLHRGPHPVLVMSRAGDLLAAWGGDGLAAGVHGIYISRETDGEYVYITDYARHCIVKYTLDGRPLWTLGEPGHAGAAGEPFNQPTDVAVTPEGELYVSDGYTNTRIHHFDQQGKLVRSWGEPGKNPGQFNIPHDVWFDTRNGRRRVWVCDRENNRLQVFTPEGEFIEAKNGFHFPTAIWVNPQGMMVVTELAGRVWILDNDDRIVGQIGDDLAGRTFVLDNCDRVIGQTGVEEGLPSGTLVNPHCVWGDSHGDLYIGEVMAGKRIQKFVRAPAFLMQSLK